MDDNYKMLVNKFRETCKEYDGLEPDYNSELHIQYLRDRFFSIQNEFARYLFAAREKHAFMREFKNARRAQLILEVIAEYEAAGKKTSISNAELEALAKEEWEDYVEEMSTAEAFWKDLEGYVNRCENMTHTISSRLKVLESFRKSNI